MLEINDEQFDQLIGEAMDALPQQYIKNMKNVAVVYADEPTSEQREKLRLRCDQMLFGLYEGIPLTKRNNNYSFVLPDKITLFKSSLLHVSPSLIELKQQIKHTLWHEIAHHFGLDHDRIHQLENK